MKIIYLVVAMVVTITTQAQIEKVSFQASGLTCSMCSNSIFKALKTLDFVETVDVDLKTYTFDLTFNGKSEVDFDKIRRKVEGAGFSIIDFVATVNFKNVTLHAVDPVVIGNNKVVFVNLKQEVEGVKRIRILNKGFVSSKEFRRNDV